MSKKELETEKTILDGNKEKPVKLEDANILLNSGKMGFVFIGVVIGFFALTLFMSFINIPSILYIFLLLLSLPVICFYYLRIHANDEDKLD